MKKLGLWFTLACVSSISLANSGTVYQCQVNSKGNPIFHLEIDITEEEVIKNPAIDDNYGVFVRWDRSRNLLRLAVMGPNHLDATSDIYAASPAVRVSANNRVDHISMVCELK